MPSCGSNVGTETSAPLVVGIVNYALFQSNSHINQMSPQITHSLRFVPDLVINWIDVRAVLEVHTGLLHYCTFGLEAANNAQNVSVDTARGKANEQQNLLKMIMCYRSVYNQIAYDV